MPDIINWDRVNKNKGGRPMLYDNAEDLQKDIQAYFDSCWQYKYNKDGEVVIDEYGNPIWTQTKPYTMSGLALAIGMDRQTLLNYEKREMFFGTIQEARKKVEEYAESRLYDRDGNRGAIFNLQNNFKGWEDKKKIDGNMSLNYEQRLKELTDSNEY